MNEWTGSNQIWKGSGSSLLLAPIWFKNMGDVEMWPGIAVEQIKGWRDLLKVVIAG